MSPFFCFSITVLATSAIDQRKRNSKATLTPKNADFGPLKDEMPFFNAGRGFPNNLRVDFYKNEIRIYLFC